MNRSYTGVPSIKGLLLVGLLIFCGYQIFTTFNSRNWPEATGKVTGYEIQETYVLRGRRDYRSPHVYTPVIQYVYLVDHVSHEGTLKLETFQSRNEAVNFAGSAYHKGRHLPVYYNPKMPSLSTLTRSTI